MAKKPQAHINIEVADNGVLCSVKLGKDCIGARVFKTEEGIKEPYKWANSLIQEKLGNKTTIEKSIEKKEKA